MIILEDPIYNITVYRKTAIRYYYKAGDLWFCAVDIANALNLSSPTGASLGRLVKAEHKTSPGGGRHRLTLISLEGLRTCLPRSHKTEAKALLSFLENLRLAKQ